MKVITGNITKEIYDKLYNSLEKYGLYLANFNYNKVTKPAKFDKKSFDKWVKYFNDFDRVSINECDIYYIEELFQLEPDSKVVIIGDLPTDDEGNLIEWADSYLFIEEPDVRKIANFLKD